MIFFNKNYKILYLPIQIDQTSIWRKSIRRSSNPTKSTNNQTIGNSISRYKTIRVIVCTFFFFEKSFLITR